MVYGVADFFVDAVLVALVIVFVYLLHSRGYIQSLFYPHHVEAVVELKAEEREREEYLKKVRERKKIALDEARQEKRKLEHMRDEAKKRLMKGEIDSATFRDILASVHKDLIEVDSRIKVLEGI